MTRKSESFVADALGGLEVEVDLGRGVLGPQHDLVRFHHGLGLDLSALLVLDLHAVGLEAQHHGAEPGLPGDLKLSVGSSGAGLEVANFRELLERHAERSHVTDQGFLGGRASRDSDRAITGERVDRDLGEPGDPIERLVKRQVADVEIERRIGHLGAELLSQVGDGVAGLLLKLADGVAEPHPLGLDCHLACPGLRFLFGVFQRGTDTLEPLLPLLAGDSGRGREVVARPGLPA